jgi:hypothetical protein
MPDCDRKIDAGRYAHARVNSDRCLTWTGELAARITAGWSRVSGFPHNVSRHADPPRVVVNAYQLEQLRLV